MSGLQRWLSWSKAHDWKSCLRGTVTRVRIPFSAPNKKVPEKGAFCLCNERGRDSKGTAERSEAKKRPVDVFLVPRAGGGTAPVPPDESLALRQTKKYPIRALFCLCNERGRDSKGTAERFSSRSGAPLRRWSIFHIPNVIAFYPLPPWAME